MQITRSSVLPCLARLYQICNDLDFSMTPTECGFLVTARPGVSNSQLRSTLAKACRDDGLRYLIAHAWGTGEYMDQGLHFVDV